MAKSRNKSGQVKNYTDSDAILDDQVLQDSFDQHFDKWKLGEIRHKDENSDSKINEPNSSIASSMGQTFIGNARRQNILPHRPGIKELAKQAPLYLGKSFKTGMSLRKNQQYEDD